MADGNTVPSDDAQFLRELVRVSVAGHFDNAYAPGTPGVCIVCRAPADRDRCGRCLDHQRKYGDLLADRTIILTYALGYCPDGHHQSAHEVRAYKGFRGAPAVARCRENLQLMIRSSVELHRGCFDTSLGAAWNALTFVPSNERPGSDHPVSALARAVTVNAALEASLRKFLLQPGPDCAAKRQLSDDKFVVPEKWRDTVEGSHVLIVDDTWTTGASAQGAAIAVKQAGAATVTVLCVSRWLRWDWADQRALIESLVGGYDPLYCPVGGTVCSAMAAYRSTLL
ncbi:ComF family protein [Nocardia carnea]|uniref:ComF family protein n=1 Tax=Nocardia carnea TaxID=37328 RepID=UPI0024573BB0|nr:hypothetical protein [Nocardia carnea]